MRASRLYAALVGPSLLLAAASAGAQSGGLSFLGGRLNAEAARSNYHFADTFQHHTFVYTDRYQLTWQPIGHDPSRSASIASRFSIGAFYEESPEQNIGMKTRFVGGVVEMRPWPSPILGHLEPIATLGLGQFRVSDVIAASHADVPLAGADRSYFGAAPGVGLRLRLITNLAIRGDVRELITSNSGNRFTYSYQGGVGLIF